MHIDKLSSYNFTLPESQIANQLATPPDSCKLMVYDRKNQTISHKHFYDIVDILDKDSILYFNDTRVVKARLKTKDHVFINHLGKAFKNRDREMFYLRSIDKYHHIFTVHPWPKFVVWSKIIIDDYGKEKVLEVVDTIENTKVIKYDGDIFELLEKYGQMPLPHYIKDIKNPSQYQPITAHPQKYGSVASPTATLHFTDQLIKNIKNTWINVNHITLHIWLGTFQAIYSEDIYQHDIHRESVQVPRNIRENIYNHKQHHKKIVATGTTTCRTLESLWLAYLSLKSEIDLGLCAEASIWREHIWQNTIRYYKKNFQKYNICEDKKILDDIISIVSQDDHENINFDTKIYIIPGYSLQIVDQIITNFHLPKSSLFIMICSIIWLENGLICYKEAIKKDYKFYSLGDSMLIL